MSLKKLSYLLLIALSFNIHSMEEQNNEKPGEEKNTEQNHNANSPKVKKLKYYCAQAILKNNGVTETLPEDLKNYLKYFDKHKELRKHKLAPIFKKYLINCFDYLSLEDLETILQIIDIAHTVSEQKCMLIQRKSQVTCKRVFCDNPTTMIAQFQLVFPNHFDECFAEILEEKRKLYDGKLSNLKSDDQSIRSKLSNTLFCIQILQSRALKLDSLLIKQCIDAALNGDAPSLNRLGILLGTNIGILSTIDCIRELLQLKSIDYANELIYVAIISNYVNPQFAHPLLSLQRRNFCTCLNDFIELVFDGNNYKDDYDITLAFIYNYLNDNAKAKKHAKKRLAEYEDLAYEELFQLLRNIYQQEGKEAKAEFYSNKIKEIENIKNS